MFQGFCHDILSRSPSTPMVNPLKNYHGIYTYIWHIKPWLHIIYIVIYTCICKEREIYICIPAILPILSLLLMVIPLTQIKHDFPSAAPSSVDAVASTSLSSQMLKDVPLGRDKSFGHVDINFNTWSKLGISYVDYFNNMFVYIYIYT